MGVHPSKAKLANEYRTNCKVCPDGIYTGEDVVWGRGRYVGLVHTRCALAAGIQTQAMPLSAGQPTDTRQRAAVAASGLTQRQAEVLQLRSDGLKPTEIADKLGITAMTVHNNLRNARLNLDADSIDDAVTIARRRGLVTRPDPS